MTSSNGLQLKRVVLPITTSGRRYHLAKSRLRFVLSCLESWLSMPCLRERRPSLSTPARSNLMLALTPLSWHLSHSSKPNGPL
uniref:Histone H2B n=1 Tax=Parascaris univalens TaxID=6257 RepID=A0A915BQ92_PARUN